MTKEQADKIIKNLEVEAKDNMKNVDMALASNELRNIIDEFAESYNNLDMEINQGYILAFVERRIDGMTWEKIEKEVEAEKVAFNSFMESANKINNILYKAFEEYQEKE